LIKITGLTFDYGPQGALKEVSHLFRPGRLYFLAGPNGAGKSTLLSVLARLNTPQKGQILINSQPISGLTDRALAGLIALAPQKFNFTLPFTVREIVAMGRRPYLGRWGLLSAKDHEIVENSLNVLNLDHLARRPVTALSGGEAQRVVVARTLAQTTPAVLMDEPTANLDVAQSLELMSLLKTLAEEGRTVVVVSHDLSLAAVYAQEMLFLKNGRLVAAGPLAETMTPELLETVFEAEARVGNDDFTGGLALSFRPRPKVRSAPVSPSKTAESR
jgi:iron complex transport system ATP-binding protein